MFLHRDGSGRLVEALGYCSCGADEDCKHAAAVLLASLVGAGAAGMPRLPVPGWTSRFDELFGTPTQHSEDDEPAAPARVAGREAAL